MKNICPICKKPVKSDQSQANIPVGIEVGFYKYVLCHLDCVLKTPDSKLKRLFPFYYDQIKEGERDNSLPPKKSDEQEMKGAIDKGGKCLSF